jgi:hypothetical protein
MLMPCVFQRQPEFLYPGQLDEVLHRVTGVGSEYQVLFDHGPDGRDYTGACGNGGRRRGFA